MTEYQCTRVGSCGFITLKTDNMALYRKVQSLCQEAVEKALQAAQAQAQKAENDRKSVQEQLEAAQKAAKVSNPNLTAVQVISQRMMADWNIILGHRKAAIEEDPGNEEGIDGFLNKLLDTMLHSL